jgi:ophiobolin F synthase
LEQIDANDWDSFVEALVLFGMGLTLTKEEDALLEPIRKPCFAALAIANDYVSFDREYAEFEDSGKLHSLKNAVWLQMRLHDVDVDVAKKMVLDITRQYEDQFLENCMRFRREDSNASEKLNLYLDALAYQVPGNLVWSLNAPRYHSDARYDPNAGLEDEISAKLLPTALGINYNVRIVNTVKEDSHQPGTVGPDANGGHSRKASTDTCLTISDETGSTTDDNASVSSRSSVSSSSEIEKTIAVHTPMSECLDSRHVKAPVDYIKSLPSGGARDIFVNALAIWFDAPPEIVSRIKSLGNRLHSASLILDDIEDGSGLRRGQPAAHTVFGTAQTINSGCYEILKAVEEAQQLGSEAVKIVLEELDDLHIGQSYDLYWTQHSLCPSEDEYLEMVTKKTGGLFRLMARLLLEFSVNKVSNKHLITDIEHLVSLIGMQYQIRDDYQNLYCEDYCEKKGFCQDLDEGKFSFPLIHALNVHSDSTKLLRELLQRRRDVGCLSFEQKKLVLRQLDCAGSMTYTRETLKRLEGEVYEGVKRVEGATKMENWILRALLQKLEV